jgi:hypothetical protein
MITEDGETTPCKPVRQIAISKAPEQVEPTFMVEGFRSTARRVRYFLWLGSSSGLT